MDTAGISKPEELAELCGLPPYKESSPKMARRWINGEVAPKFDYLMAMLDRAGMLSPEMRAAWRGRPARPTPALEAGAASGAEGAARRSRAG